MCHGQRTNHCHLKRGLQDGVRDGQRGNTSAPTEMKHSEGQGSSHPRSSLRPWNLGSWERAHKHASVCSSLVNHWLNKWTAPLWYHPVSCRLLEDLRGHTCGLTDYDKHLHTNLLEQQGSRYLVVSHGDKVLKL